MDINADGHSVQVRIADQVTLKRTSELARDGVQIALELSWSTLVPARNEFSAATAF
jgi:hypothetical protein